MDHRDRRRSEASEEMELQLPSSHVSDWHLVLRLSLYPERSKLHGYTYKLNAATPTPSVQLFTPRLLDRPECEWDALQSLLLGVDLIAGRLYPWGAEPPF